ncbi:polysaccharide deacetylase [Thalassotalea loyana]|uniref:Polysaccharide deacetylase n=1 Tax=Thalassotalea loyana TaxID=280483 RepID=A0ABQ6HI98_9GAMM|nr:polysaccharide deacetylase family protein [Thalassotalea loyana]GLX86656.1 polysaccharide deacetylase [Thalassotalea loyana]
MKILTFDIEDWFHLLDNPSTESINDWVKFESRIHNSVEVILHTLEKRNLRATFFILGWVADKYPDIVKKIDKSGHHIGTHSYAHQLAYKQSPREFEDDLRRSIGALEELTSKPINCYRAPGFSIVEENLWAFDILVKNGIEIDCSIFPASRAHGGLPNIEIKGPSVGIVGKDELKLFPINSKNIFGKDFIYSGGGYFRLLPKALLKNWFRNSTYVMTYFHPRDFDVNQPVLEGLSLSRRFKSYVGISGCLNKLESMLDDNQFISLESATNNVDWAIAPRLKLR